MQFILTTGKHVYNDSQSSSTTTSCLIKIYYKTSTIRKRDFLKRNNSDHISFSSFSRLVDPEIKSALLVCIFPKKINPKLMLLKCFSDYINAISQLARHSAISGHLKWSWNQRKYKIAGTRRKKKQMSSHCRFQRIFQAFMTIINLKLLPNGLLVYFNMF